MEWTNGYGKIEVFALFRCTCGGMTSMADQENGHAAMTHTTPRCDRFERLTTQVAALSYFKSLEEIDITPERLRELERNTVSA